MFNQMSNIAFNEMSNIARQIGLASPEKTQSAGNHAAAGAANGAGQPQQEGQAHDEVAAQGIAAPLPVEHTPRPPSPSLSFQTPIDGAPTPPSVGVHATPSASASEPQYMDASPDAVSTSPGPFHGFVHASSSKLFLEEPHNSAGHTPGSHLQSPQTAMPSPSFSPVPHVSEHAGSSSPSGLDFEHDDGVGETCSEASLPVGETALGLSPQPAGSSPYPPSQGAAGVVYQEQIGQHTQAHGYGAPAQHDESEEAENTIAAGNIPLQNDAQPQQGEQNHNCVTSFSAFVWRWVASVPCVARARAVTESSSTPSTQQEQPGAAQAQLDGHEMDHDDGHEMDHDHCHEGDLARM